jgi:polysaccharide export outer membrane protein
MTSRLLPILVVCALSVACVTVGCRTPTQDSAHAARARAREAAADTTPPAYAIQSGDTIAIRFVLTPEFDSDVPVRPDGKFALPLLGEVQAAGLTPVALHDELVTAYTSHLRHPEISVNVATFASNVAYIGGEVRNPSVVSLMSPTSALRAIMAAGGSLDSGNLKKVVIVRDRGTPEPEILMVDLSRGLQTLENAEDLWLRPRDMVFVPKTGISQANQFIREYIRDMLPIQSSFSLQYQFTSLP